MGNRPLLRLVSESPSTPLKDEVVGKRRAFPVEDEAGVESIPPVDDAQLLAAIRAGDEAAAAELHDRLRPRVDATIRALLGVNHCEHDDLAQQSFIEIVLSLERYRGECSLETWARSISARIVFKYLRRRTTERKIFRAASSRSQSEASSSGDRSSSPSSTSPSGFPDPPSSSLNRRLIAKDLADRVRTHLDTMDPAKAEAFLLHDVCGFDAREVAGIADISEAAAHARIARGRRELQALLAADPELRDALVDMEVEP
jgi:RNA polymerase sigma factor (sigma-70 family)